jgi:DNA-binding phage protein
MKNKHIGSSFDDFLEAAGIKEDVELLAAKKLLAIQVRKEMERQHLSKITMAKRMHTSRAQLDRVLDPTNKTTTLETISRAARAVGRHLQVKIV